MSFRTNFSYLEGRLFTYEESTTPTGKVVSKITLLISNSKDKSSFIPVEAWQQSDKLRAVLNANAGKCRIAVQGEIEMDQWEDKQTKAKRSRLKIVARQVSYLGLAKEREDRDDKDDKPSKEDAGTVRPSYRTTQKPPAPKVEVEPDVEPEVETPKIGRAHV